MAGSGSSPSYDLDETLADVPMEWNGITLDASGPYTYRVSASMVATA